MRALAAAAVVVVAGAAGARAAAREPWDDLRWLGGGFRGASCAGEAWLAAYNFTQDRMLRGEIAPRFVVVRPHARAGLGNRLRAIRAALTVAVLARRCLVVDYGTAPPGDAARDSRANATELDYLGPGLVRWDAARRLWAATLARRGTAFGTKRLAANAANLDVAAVAASTAGQVVVEAWNHDPTERLRRSAGAAADAVGLGPALAAARLAACANRALFGPTPRLARALAGARRALGVARLDAAVHLRTNVEFARDWGSFGCRDVACWSGHAEAFAACAAALTRGVPPERRTLLVAADDAGLVAAVLARENAAATWTAVALDAAHRRHSGLSRPRKQLEMERRQGHVLGHGDVLGPLLDLLLLASARAFVGTAGSSFSEQALAWGAFDVDDEGRRAVLFTTPFAKSGGARHAGGVPGPAVPDTPAAAAHACAARRQ